MRWIRYLLHTQNQSSIFFLTIPAYTSLQFNPTCIEYFMKEALLHPKSYFKLDFMVDTFLCQVHKA